VKAYLKNNHSKGLEVWLKQWNACLASAKPLVQTPVPSIKIAAL
jgi:hypothetical protein